MNQLDFVETFLASCFDTGITAVEFLARGTGRSRTPSTLLGARTWPVYSEGVAGTLHQLFTRDTLLALVQRAQASAGEPSRGRPARSRCRAVQRYDRTQG